MADLRRWRFVLPILVAGGVTVAILMDWGMTDDRLRHPGPTTAEVATPDLSSALKTMGNESAVMPATAVNGGLEPLMYGGKILSYTVKLTKDDPAGLKNGDVIISVGNQPLSDFSVASDVQQLIKVGDEVVLRRNGNQIRFAYGYPKV